MNVFGGFWTNQKIEIVVEYTKVYLEIMKSRRYWKLLYFDGFAGSGKISKEEHPGGKEIIEGVAKRILAINEPRSFDNYYFVEKRKRAVHELREIIDSEFPSKKLISSVVTGDCNEKLKDIDWVIVGGESGKKPRPMKKEWVVEIMNACNTYNVPFFFKQWGGRSKKKSGRLLNGQIYNHMPLKAVA